MAIKKKLIECECGEIFTDAKNNQLNGNVGLGPWLLKESRKRPSKSQGDVLFATFERSVFCLKCKQELVRENRQYELTPPISHVDEVITSHSTREFIYRSKVKSTEISDSFNAGTVDQVLAEK
jgi:hypothetical protein